MSQIKIEKLTPQQEALIGVYREKWRRIALSTDAIDRQKASNAVKAAYERIGYQEPEIIFCDSPEAACSLISQHRNQLSREWWMAVFMGKLGCQLHKQMRMTLWNQLDSQLDTELWNQLATNPWSQLDSQLDSQFDNELWNLFDRFLHREYFSHADRFLLRFDDCALQQSYLPVLGLFYHPIR